MQNQEISEPQVIAPCTTTRSSKVNGPTDEARERKRENSRRWRLRHREQARTESRERARLWRAAHPKETLALARESMRLWRVRHQVESRAKARRWRIAHPQLTRVIARRTYLRNKERVAEQTRRWRVANRTKWLEQKHLRYMKVGHASSVRWLRRMRPDLPFICAIGGGPADHADHLWPVSLGGPADDPMNLRYLCARHNTMRGAARRTDRELREIPCSEAGSYHRPGRPRSAQP